MKEIEHDNKWLEEAQDGEPTQGEVEGYDADTSYDPFSPEHAPALSLITLMRIYDVGLALLREENAQVAEQLVRLHAEGKVLGPLPSLNLEDD